MLQLIFAGYFTGMMEGVAPLLEWRSWNDAVHDNLILMVQLENESGWHDNYWNDGGSGTWNDVRHDLQGHRIK